MILSVASGKGGVGKSTLCASLGMAFAHLGYKTLVMELDFGLRSLDMLFGVASQVVYDLGDYMNGTATLEQVVLPCPQNNNLWLICSPNKLSNHYKLDQFVDCCNALHPYFQIILLDTPAGLGLNASLSARVADSCLCVATPDPIACRDVAYLCEILKGLGHTKQRLILNRVQVDKPQLNAIKDLDEAINLSAARLIGIVPEDPQVQSTFLQGGSLDFKGLFGMTAAAIAKRCLGERVPLVVRK